MSIAAPAPRLAVAAPVVAAEDARARHALTSVAKFTVLSAQLFALVWAFRAFQLEERAFLTIMGVAAGGFCIHYWLPFRLKEPFWIAMSLLGGGLLLGPLPLAFLLVVGMAFYGLLSSPLPYRAKLAAAVGLGGLLMAGRAAQPLAVPATVWPVLGALFMFRMMVYLYDLRQAKGLPSAQEFLAYFFPLPNFYFLLFPVIDLQTQRRTYYQRDIHAMAQQGLLWMARGAVQLLLYRLVYFLKPSFDPDEVVSFGTLVTAMVGTYLLYLRVSGQFHLIVGLLHLFGYDLPETHRRYLLANSITDFWRRINIYWKDFMVKIVYFPVYFRYRRSGDLRAKVVATVCVFVVTWALHSYQWFWLRGEWLLSWTDTLFWAILGGLVIGNLLIEHYYPPRRTAVTGAAAVARNALQVAGTLTLIVVLWSFWQSPTIEEWTAAMTTWAR